MLRFSIILMFLSMTALPVNSSERDEDIIGVYFDLEATTAVHETTAPDEWVQYWVAVKNMSAPDSLRVIEFRLERNGDGVGLMLSLIGSQLGYYGGDFSFSAEPPIPNRDLILICYDHVLVSSPQQRYEFNIMPIEVDDDIVHLLYLSTGGELIQLTPSSGSYDEPVAVINPDGALPDEHSTWGEIKSIYR